MTKYLHFEGYFGSFLFLFCFVLLQLKSRIARNNKRIKKKISRAERTMKYTKEHNDLILLEVI